MPQLYFYYKDLYNILDYKTLCLLFYFLAAFWCRSVQFLLMGYLTYIWTSLLRFKKRDSLRKWLKELGLFIINLRFITSGNMLKCNYGPLLAKMSTWKETHIPTYISMVDKLVGGIIKYLKWWNTLSFLIKSNFGQELDKIYFIRVNEGLI